MTETEEKDINDIFDDLLLSEDKFVQEGYEEGVTKGLAEGNVEGYHLGYHRGAEIGAEIGYYFAIGCFHLSMSEDKPETYPDKVVKLLNKLKEAIKDFPQNNSEEVDIFSKLENIRGLFKRICSLLKIENDYSSTVAVSF